MGRGRPEDPEAGGRPLRVGPLGDARHGPDRGRSAGDDPRLLRLPAAHVALAQKLAFLRDEGVLVLGSGDVVHNLGVVDWANEGGYDWAERFDAEVRRRITGGDLDALVAYERLPDAPLAVPTPEHYLPLLYVLALGRPGDAVSFFNEKVVLGSISMTSVVLGG